MRRILLSLLALAAARALPARADDAKAKSDTMTVERSTVKGTAAGGQVEQITGTVTALDLAKREVSIKGPKGNVETMTVSKEAQNLDQVKVGDKVVVTFYRGVALTYLPPGTPAPTPEVSGAAEAAPKGAKPGGEAQVTVRGTVTVTNIDLKSRTVTLKGPEGAEYRVKAGPDVQIDKLKVGDKIYAVYQEGIALSVQPAKAKAKKK